MTPQDKTNRDQAATNEGQDAKNVANVYELKILHQQLDQLRERSEEQIEKLEGKLAKLERDRDSALIWGVVTLGAALISLLAWIATKVVPKNLL